MGEQSVNVRGIGVIGSVDDIEKIVLTQQGGVPVLLSDVAKVQIGFTPRLGIAGRDDKTDIDLRHRADAEARTHDGRGPPRAYGDRYAQHRRQLAAGREGRAVLRSR